MRVDYVVATRACFGTGVVTSLFAQDALEYAVALAGDAVVTWAFIVVVFQRVVAVALGASNFAVGYGAFPCKVVHRVATRALDDDSFVSAVDKLDLAAEHAHSLKCSTLRDGLVLFDICE